MHEKNMRKLPERLRKLSERNPVEELLSAIDTAADTIEKLLGVIKQLEDEIKCLG